MGLISCGLPAKNRQHFCRQIRRSKTTPTSMDFAVELGADLLCGFAVDFTLWILFECNIE